MEFKGLVLFFIAFIIPFVLTVLITPLTIWLAPKIGAVDIPLDKRRMHKKKMPRCGGIAIFFAITAALIIGRYYILPNIVQYLPFDDVFHFTNSEMNKMISVAICGVIIFAVGLIDDIKQLKPFQKLGGQVFVAVLLFFLGVNIDAMSYFTDKDMGILGIIINLLATIAWIVVITNTINLIDGLDGLAAGVSAIAALAIAYASYIHGHYIVAVAMVCIVGGAAGFLPWNFYPAKTFMGDCGSMFLGFMIAAVSIIGPAKQATLLSTIMPVLVLGVPMIDTVLAIFRRIIGKKSPMEADKKHIHHRITENGMGHRKSVLMLYGIAGVMGISAIIYSRGLYVEFASLFIIAVIFISILVFANKKTKKSRLTEESFPHAEEEEKILEEKVRKAREDLEKRISELKK
jgi:UDP-GlcNAc:undecaprenyl-phosphate GlcNAc-1-phosphate transferase